MIKKISTIWISFILSFIPLFVMIPKAQAAVVAWNNVSGDNKFSTALNWAGGVLPVNGDILTFPTSVNANTVYGNDRVLNNDIVGLAVAGIQVTGTYITGDYDNYKITGNAISLSGNVTGNGSSPAYVQLSLNVATTITANVTLQSVTSASPLAIGSNTVTMSDSNFSGAYSGSGGSLIFGGTPAASGGGSSVCTYGITASSPSFSSPITINQYGSLSVTSNTQELAYSASSITLNNGSSLDFILPFGQDITFNKPVTFNGGTISAYQYPDVTNTCANPTVKKQVIIPGNVTLTADTVFSTYHADIKFTGTVTGKQFIKPYYTSSGSVLFSDGSKLDPTPITTNYTANSPGTSIYVNNNETAVVTGSYGVTTVGEGGTLKGNGTVGVLGVDTGGHLAPGMSPGCINSGNLTLAGIYDAELGGTTACTEYDQTNVTGTVTLTGGTLNVSRYNGFKPAAGQRYTIISNDAADAVTGTFTNLAEGATFTVDGYVFKISYVGGDGNDVVLTVQSVPATPDTGFSLITSNPIVTLFTTTLLAGGIALLAKHYNKIATKK